MSRSASPSLESIGEEPEPEEMNLRKLFREQLRITTSYPATRTGRSSHSPQSIFGSVTPRSKRRRRVPRSGSSPATPEADIDDDDDYGYNSGATTPIGQEIGVQLSPMSSRTAVRDRLYRTRSASSSNEDRESGNRTPTSCGDTWTLGASQSPNSPPILDIDGMVIEIEPKTDVEQTDASTDFEEDGPEAGEKIERQKAREAEAARRRVAAESAAAEITGLFTLAHNMSDL